MLRIFPLIYILLATVLAGSFVTAVVATPALYDGGMVTIPVAAAVGVIVAAPLSWLITRRLV